MLGKVLMELAGVALPAALMYAATEQFPIALLYPNLDQQQNRLYFCAIPSVVYLIARIYIGITFFVTSRIAAALPNQPSVETWLNRALISGLVVVPTTVVPQVKQVLTDTWSQYMGPVWKLVYELSKPSVLHGWEFGQRIGLLLAGWFVVLFCLELVLRVVLYSIAYIIRLVFRRSPSSESDSSKEKQE